MAKRAWLKTREEYKKHEVYYIEDNQMITFIPGGTRPLRRKWIYDKTSGKLLVSRPMSKCQNIEFVDDSESIQALDAIIQHPIRAMHKGIFLRRLHGCGLPDHYNDLLEVMNGYNLPKSINDAGKKESIKSHKKRKQQYLDMLFDLVVSEG